jgi:hypothetical protein
VLAAFNEDATLKLFVGLDTPAKAARLPPRPLRNGASAFACAAATFAEFVKASARHKTLNF